MVNWKMSINWKYLLILMYGSTYVHIYIYKICLCEDMIYTQGIWFSYYPAFLKVAIMKFWSIGICLVLVVSCFANEDNSIVITRFFSSQRKASAGQLVTFLFIYTYILLIYLLNYIY